MPYKLNDTILVMDAPFTVDRINYPADWLAKSTQAERDTLGIVWVDAQVRPDDRYYYVQDNGDGTYTATPKDLNGLKLSRIAEAKEAANNLLAPTDWYITRRVEMGTPVPVEVTTYRNDVRQCCAAIETQIEAANTIDALQAVEWLWPSADGWK